MWVNLFAGTTPDAYSGVSFPYRGQSEEVLHLESFLLLKKALEKLLSCQQKRHEKKCVASTTSCVRPLRQSIGLVVLCNIQKDLYQNLIPAGVIMQMATDISRQKV